MKMLEQVKNDTWKAKAALLLITRCHFTLKQAIECAEAMYENVNGDIDGESPEDCVDAETEEMRADVIQ